MTDYILNIECNGKEDNITIRANSFSEALSLGKLMCRKNGWTFKYVI